MADCLRLWERYDRLPCSNAVLRKAMLIEYVKYSSSEKNTVSVLWSLLIDENLLILPMTLVLGVHHFNVTVSFSPFSRVLVPAICKSPAQQTEKRAILMLTKFL